MDVTVLLESQSDCSIRVFKFDSSVHKIQRGLSQNSKNPSRSTTGQRNKVIHLVQLILSAHVSSANIVKQK